MARYCRLCDARLRKTWEQRMGRCEVCQERLEEKAETRLAERWSQEQAPKRWV